MVDFRLLSREDVDAIHGASLDVLEKVGVMVKNEPAIELLREVGCSIDGDVVRIPPSLVADSIKKAPEKFQLHSTDGGPQYTVGGSNVIYNPGSAAIFFIDRETHEMRRANAADFVDLVRLTDALEHIHAQSTAMVPADAPEIISDLYRLYVILMNSGKPIVTGAFTKEGLLDMKAMLEAVVGGSEELRKGPAAIFDCCPSSPLMWSDVTCQNLIDCAEHGIPAEIIPAPQMGATSPVSIAGTVVEANAEFLSGAVISQLVEPGAPIIYGGSPSAFDMRHCTARLGAIEAVMTACASAEMGKHYGVPTQGYLGLSDSKAVDGQSSFESGMGIMLAALTGVNIVSGPGMQASENCQSLGKLVIDNEYCGAAYRMIEGINVDSVSLAAEVITKVGPGGHFLAEKHTRENLRKERFIPSDVLDRLSPDAWVKAGSLDTTYRARERAEKILRDHEPYSLPSDAAEGLQRTLEGILERHGISLSSLPIL
ncbi:MAG: trimethylamine methyltransferase family protein [Candidatus Bathyarchaeota archaeon]|nr:MAG: trimethylamine methyltransferase family protein [Candidatus Bathyarchaeota archaeon]